MSMNSALSLSIYHHLFTICTTCRKKKLFQREINASGEPTTQVSTNWDATRGTPLVRGEPQETSLLGLKSK